MGNVIARHRAEMDMLLFGTGFVIKHGDGRVERVDPRDVTCVGRTWFIGGKPDTRLEPVVTIPEYKAEKPC